MSKVRGSKQIATAHMQREGAGFVVRRAIGGKISDCDPFLMLDHVGPMEFGPGEAVGAPDHPHRGFETVSYLVSGSAQHKDSVGNSGQLKEGWVQWMTAGSGVVHSEMPSDEMMAKGGKSEGFQLWVNLPAKDKMTPPRYQDIPTEKIPIVTTDNGNVWVKVIAGESLGAKAVIDTHTPIMMLDVHLKPGAKFSQPVPKTFNGFVYVWRGSGYFGAKRASMKIGQIAILDNSDGEVVMEAEANDVVHFLLVAGEPINEPIAKYGPFVMNTMEEIQQAFQDYHSGKLGKIDDAEERYAQAEAARNKQKESGKWSKDSAMVNSHR